jgi:nucleoside-diphosphate-sugar epimerase
LFEDVLDLMEIPYEYTSNYEIPDWYQFYTKSDKSKWIPGWKPEYNLESGIKDYKEYLK